MESRILNLLVIVLLLTACVSNDDSAHEHDVYTCPMHPTVLADRPGACPVCGMDLVRKARAGEEVEITEDLSQLIKSPNEVVVASVRTVKGEYKAMPVTVPVRGIVTYDARRVHAIPARVGGRLENVYIRHVFQPISKGQKLAEIYSPELVTAQRELLFLVDNDAENESLIAGAKRKLELLGMSETQILSIMKTKRVDQTVSIHSAYSGYVITEGVSAPTTSGRALADSGMDDGMGGRVQNNAVATTPSGTKLVRAGDYATRGQTLFTIADAEALRVELDVPAGYSHNVSEGSKIMLTLGKGEPQQATVDFVLPFYSDEQNFLKVRVYIRKTQGLRVGQLIDGKLHLHSTEGLWVPRTAVLSLGHQQVVFVKQRNVLKPKVVTTGATSEGKIEITRGLASADEIAENGQLLVDGEGFVRGE